MLAFLWQEALGWDLSPRSDMQSLYHRSALSQECVSWGRSSVTSRQTWAGRTLCHEPLAPYWVVPAAMPWEFQPLWMYLNLQLSFTTTRCWWFQPPKSLPGSSGRWLRITHLLIHCAYLLTWFQAKDIRNGFRPTFQCLLDWHIWHRPKPWWQVSLTREKPQMSHPQTSYHVASRLWL